MLVWVNPVDAIFTPIRKVNFTVEPIHVGQETSLERLYLEVWTDGTVTPVEAVSRAAEILIEQLNPFIGLTRVAELVGEAEAARPTIAPELANMPVEQLNLSVRTLNCLRRGNINTVGEVVSKTEKELMSLRNFGMKSKQELEERLQSLGLSLAE
jgi:DNA-directed RNA polymerase subunit alpha